MVDKITKDWSAQIFYLATLWINYKILINTDYLIVDHVMDKLQKIDQFRLSYGWPLYGQCTKDWSTQIIWWLTTLWTSYKRLINTVYLMVDHFTDKLQNIDQSRWSYGWPLHFMKKLQKIDQSRWSYGRPLNGKITIDWSAKIILWLTTLWTMYKRLISQDFLMVDNFMKKLQKIDQSRWSYGWPLNRQITKDWSTQMFL